MEKYPNAVEHWEKVKHDSWLHVILLHSNNGFILIADRNVGVQSSLSSKQHSQVHSFFSFSIDIIFW